MINEQTQCWAVPSLLRLLHFASIHSQNQLVIIKRHLKINTTTRGVTHVLPSVLFTLLLGGREQRERTRPTSASSFVVFYV